MEAEEGLGDGAAGGSVSDLEVGADGESDGGGGGGVDEEGGLDGGVEGAPEGRAEGGAELVDVLGAEEVVLWLYEERLAGLGGLRSLKVDDWNCARFFWYRLYSSSFSFLSRKMSASRSLISWDFVAFAFTSVL